MLNSMRSPVARRISDSGRRLEDADADPGLGEAERSNEPGWAAADDDDVLHFYPTRSQRDWSSCSVDRVSVSWMHDRQ